VGHGGKLPSVTPQVHMDVREGVRLSGPAPLTRRPCQARSLHTGEAIECSNVGQGKWAVKQFEL